MEQFINAEKRLLDITNELETDVIKYINPTNAVSEKERFFKTLNKGEEYNPLFTYLPKNPIFSHFTLNPEYDKILKELNALKIIEEGVGKLIEKKRTDSINKMQLIRAIGSAEFTAKSIGFYGKPKHSLVKYAEEIVALESEKEEKPLSAEDAIKIVKKRLVKEKIDLRLLTDENMSANADTLNFNKLIKIRYHSVFSKRDVNRLYVHEVWTHVYRYLNGEKQPFKLFINGTDRNWQITEEGLAAVNEEVFGFSSIERLRNYAGRVLAVDFALKHSFSETFSYLEQFFSREDAYQLTQRVKRGMHNTENAGAFTKDFFYLEGRKRIKRFLQEDGDLKELYYGKIAIEDLDVLKEVPQLIKPSYVPKYGKNLLEKLEKY